MLRVRIRSPIGKLRLHKPHSARRPWRHHPTALQGWSRCWWSVRGPSSRGPSTRGAWSPSSRVPAWGGGSQCQGSQGSQCRGSQHGGGSQCQGSQGSQEFQLQGSQRSQWQGPQQQGSQGFQLQGSQHGDPGHPCGWPPVGGRGRVCTLPLDLPPDLGEVHGERRLLSGVSPASHQVLIKQYCQRSCDTHGRRVMY